MNPDDILLPPEVRFSGPNHHQFFRMKVEAEQDFDDTTLMSLSSISVTFANITSGQIPSWNISGLSKNIYQIIQEMMRDSCEP